MVPLIGYVDWFSARPGERIAVKVSSRLAEPYQADLVRIIHGDDRGPYALHGTLRNLPTRAVCGSRWTGEETAWRHRPRHYAAIHFHEDDLYDCGTTMRWKCYRASACRSGGPRSAPGSLASRQRDTLAAEYQRIRGFRASFFTLSKRKGLPPMARIGLRQLSAAYRPIYTTNSFSPASSSPTP